MMHDNNCETIVQRNTVDLHDEVKTENFYHFMPMWQGCSKTRPQPPPLPTSLQCVLPENCVWSVEDTKKKMVCLFVCPRLVVIESFRFTWWRNLGWLNNTLSCVHMHQICHALVLPTQDAKDLTTFVAINHAKQNLTNKACVNRQNLVNSYWIGVNLQILMHNIFYLFLCVT